MKFLGDIKMYMFVSGTSQLMYIEPKVCRFFSRAELSLAQRFSLAIEHMT